MKIGIVGAGVVGSATARAFSGFVDEVRVYDVVPERATVEHMADVLDCDLTFICLPSPQKQGSLECDTSAIDEVLDGYAYDYARDRYCNLVLRSTVPIGYTRRMREKHNLPNLVHSPEFLTARTATFDAMMPARNIVGVPCSGRLSERVTHADDCEFLLKSLLADRYPGVPTYTMTSDESEATKLFQNAFSAVKIATFNEFRTLADAKGLDWERVMQGLLAGGWISPMHTQVPGRDGFGFGGSCLPKDLANLISHYNEEHLVTRAAYRRNLIDRERTDSGA